MPRLHTKAQGWLPKWFKKDLRTWEQRRDADIKAKEEYNKEQEIKERNRFAAEFENRRQPVEYKNALRESEIDREIEEIQQRCPTERAEFQRRLPEKEREFWKRIDKEKEILEQNCDIKQEKLLREKEEIDNIRNAYATEVKERTLDTYYKKANPFEDLPIPQRAIESTWPTTGGLQTRKPIRNSATYLRYRDIKTGRFVSPAMYTRR